MESKFLSAIGPLVNAESGGSTFRERVWRGWCRIFRGPD